LHGRDAQVLGVALGQSRLLAVLLRRGFSVQARHSRRRRQAQEILRA
jgi:hypothetical protein